MRVRLLTLTLFLSVLLSPAAHALRPGMITPEQVDALHDAMQAQTAAERLATLHEERAAGLAQIESEIAGARDAKRVEELHRRLAAHKVETEVLTLRLQIEIVEARTEDRPSPEVLDRARERLQRAEATLDRIQDPRSVQAGEGGER